MDAPATLPDLDPAFATPTLEEGIAWYDLRAFGIEGRGWTDTETDFDRLPARAKGVVRDPIWELGQRAAGLRARFVTDATRIVARWSVRRTELALNIMPATAVSGVDLYAEDQGRWRYAGTGRPTGTRNEYPLIGAMTPAMRHFLLYLPLYNGIEEIRIGIPEGAAIGRAPAYPVSDPRPICFYGTSINQGGCASRPGMCHIAILHRRLNRPVLNIGFGGNARCEPEIAQLLAELDPACYVIDPAANMSEAELLERLGPLVQDIRSARPQTPILMVGSIEYQDAWLNTGRRKRCDAAEAAILKVYQSLREQGVGNLHHLPGLALLGADGDATVDGTHPTDLGFLRMADALEPVLREILGG